jgi:putative ABC transport system permease protein
VNLLARLVARFPALVIAKRNISRAKSRSALAALAIVIGVVAIGAIGAGGAAFKQSQLESIENRGATDVFVLPGVDNEQGHFDRTDVTEIEQTVGESGVVATQEATLAWHRRGDRRERVSTTYIDDPRTLFTVERGAIPDNWRRTLVLSNEFATEHNLSVDDRLTVVREEQTARGTRQVERTYRVVAVLAEVETFGGSDAYLPLAAAPERTYSQVRIQTASVDRAEAVAGTVRERFNGRKDRVLVFELTSLVRLLTQIVNGINVFLASLGSISLLVAGVSIANTMLMAVIKRREEIGVLRAVGYSKQDIMRILLVEAAMLGAIGAAIGLVLSLLVVMAANAVFVGNAVAFTGESLLYLGAAVGFGVVTSLVAGVYPAWRAANEQPVEALRG